MVYSLESLSDSTLHEWDDFSNRSQEGTLYHSIQWKTLLDDELKLPLRYYLIRDDRRIVGICPCAEHSAMHMRGLTDIPYSDFNNLVLDDSFDTAGINDILSLFSREYSFVQFNARSSGVLESIEYDNFPIEDSGHMLIDLKEKPPDAIWSTFSKKMRKDIHIFENKGFEVKEIDQQRDIERYYQYHVENLTHIGGNIMPFSFFKRTLGLSGDVKVRTVVLSKGDLFAGGMQTLAYPSKKMANFECLALNRALPNQFTPTYYLIWEGINWAWDHGMTKISLGRQKFEPDKPRFRNKVKLGAEYVPIQSRLVVFSKIASFMYQKKIALEKRVSMLSGR